MRLNLSTPALLALSSLIHLSTALPFFHRKALPLRALVRRATYSIVPVDGGPIPTEAPEETVIQTIVHTKPPKTKTILQTDNVTLPPVTDYVLKTKTIEGSKETQTVVVTITPTPEVEITTSYSIIDVEGPSETTKVITSTAARSTSSSTSSTAPSQSRSSAIVKPTSTLSSSQSISTSTPALSASLTSLSTPSPTSASSTITSSSSSSSSSASITSTPTSTTKSFDDGQWKTYYPAWNDTRTVGAYIRAIRPTSSSASIPTLAPVAIRSAHEAGANAAVSTRKEISRKSSVEKKDANMEFSPRRRSPIAKLLAISGAWFQRL